MSVRSEARNRSVHPKKSRTPLPVAGWVILCAILNCAGWFLSALHQLNPIGYVAILAATAIGFAWWWRQSGLHFDPARKLMKWRRRFRRPFALAFFVLALLTFLGGALHAPNNYDGLAYRLPRMLNWLAEGKWHWIHTDFARVNTRTCGIEWVSVPLIALTKSDRLLFLINTISFLLLPGLVFSIFTRVGVRPRTAWYWMWLAPSGYGFLLQAGSISNDMFGAVFVLAALDFALRARKSGRVSDVCLSVLAAAMMTSSKASNLPLLLPWAVAILPTWRLCFSKPLVLAALILPTIGASLIPTAILNQRNCGDWTGLRAEQPLIGHGPAWVHVIGNAGMYLVENLAPPVFPFSSAWNHLMDKSIPHGLAVRLQQCFEPEAAHWHLAEMQMEEGAGLGFGVTIIFGLSLVVVVLGRPRGSNSQKPTGQLVLWFICLLPWMSLLFMMTKMGLAGGARYLTPYYFLLMMGPLTLAGHAVLVRTKWWRGLSYVSFAMAVMLAVISPARPLWPVGWFVRHYGSRLQASRLGARAIDVYTVYGKRSEAFNPVIAVLPKDATLLGFVTADDPEESLWKPFGSRRVVHVRASDSGDEIRRRGIKYVLVHVDKLDEPWNQWLQRVNGRVLNTLDLRLRVSSLSPPWQLIELNPEGGQTSGGKMPPTS